jgi:CRISPR system Cascade subunit CasB
MTPADLFQKLEERASADTAVVAVLRRSLAYDPGLYPPAFPYVEPLAYGQGEWRRQATYLVAACWAKGQRALQDEKKGIALSLASALRKLRDDPKQSQAGESLTKRFTALLDADSDELPWRLRQITSQLNAAGIDLDWPALLEDLWHWNHSKRSVQVKWARESWSPTRPSPAEKEKQVSPGTS